MARHALGREAQGAQKMTTPNLIEAARAARNALDNLIDAQNGPPLIDQADEWDCAMYEAHAAIDALRAAIEAAESAEPVAMLYRQNETGRSQVVMRGEAMLMDNRWHMAGPLYLHPPDPARQPMTLDDVLASDALMDANASIGVRVSALMRLVRAVEAFHGIRSSGEEPTR